MLEFVRPRHHCLLLTTRADGSPQLSPVTCGVDAAGRLVIATYPERAKTVNARRNPTVSACILSDDFNGPWIQLDGQAEVLDMPEALDGPRRVLPLHLGRTPRLGRVSRRHGEAGKEPATYDDRALGSDRDRRLSGAAGELS